MTGEGRVLLTTNSKLNLTGDLIINSGSFQYGNGNIATSNTTALACGSIIIENGGQFIHQTEAVDLGTDIYLNGGDFDILATGPRSYLELGQLALTNAADGTVSELGFNWDSKLRFDSITGTGDLDMVTYPQGGYGALFIDMGSVSNFGGTVNIVDEIATRISSFTISGAHHQDAGIVATFNDVNVIGDDFSLSGSGGLTIEQSLNLTGAAATLSEATLQVGSLTGSVDFSITDGGTLSTSTAGINSYTGKITLDGATLTLSDDAAITQTLTIAAGGATITGAAS